MCSFYESVQINLLFLLKRRWRNWDYFKQHLYDLTTATEKVRTPDADVDFQSVQCYRTTRQDFLDWEQSAMHPSTLCTVPQYVWHKFDR